MTTSVQTKPVTSDGKQPGLKLRVRRFAEPATRIRKFVLALPFCAHCNSHIGLNAKDGLCGACKRELRCQPIRLSLAELKCLIRLVRLHWGDGRLRSLLLAQNDTPRGYSPCLVTAIDPRQSSTWTSEERADFQRNCAERAELADLYDRAQASRNDPRRAVRS